MIISTKQKNSNTDQHREAAQKRRLYIDVAGSEKIDSQAVFKRFDYKCFKCGKDLKDIANEKERALDHTLPAFYLWPLTTENATLLCSFHNGEKAGKWPSEYYSQEELKRLSIITGIDFQLLSGLPIFNPNAIEKLQSPEIVDQLLFKYAAYFTEIIKIHNRILTHTGLDFFKFSRTISKKWIKLADEQLK